MKIDNKVTPRVAGDVAGDLQGPRASPARATDTGPQEGTEVRISTLAEQLQAIQGQLASGEVVDAQRVAEIRQAIAQGKFQINPDAIADKLIESVRELLQGQRTA